MLITRPHLQGPRPAERPPSARELFAANSAEQFADGLKVRLEALRQMDGGEHDQNRVADRVDTSRVLEDRTFVREQAYFDFQDLSIVEQGQGQEFVIKNHRDGTVTATRRDVQDGLVVASEQKSFHVDSQSLWADWNVSS